MDLSRISPQSMAEKMGGVDFEPFLMEPPAPAQPWDGPIKGTRFLKTVFGCFWYKKYWNQYAKKREHEKLDPKFGTWDDMGPFSHLEDPPFSEAVAIDPSTWGFGGLVSFWDPRLSIILDTSTPPKKTKTTTIRFMMNSSSLYPLVCYGTSWFLMILMGI